MSEVRGTLSGENPIAVSQAGAPPSGDDAQDVFVFPASFSQQRLWFLDALEPGSPAYNIHAAIRLRGPLDVEALASSFRSVVARHESLRTTFVSSEGMPFQVVSEGQDFEIAVDDLRALDETTREEEIERRAVVEARAPFDLSTGPLARARLLILGDEEHVLLITVHHIIADGWSMGVIYRDLSAWYAAELRGETPDLPDLPIEYADYTIWHNEFVESEDVKTQLAFWLESFGDDLPVLELPTKATRPELRSSVGATERLELDPELVRDAAAFCRAEQLSRFMLHLAALSVLFHKYSGQDEVIVGSPVAGRSRPETEASVGFFANTVAFRTDLSGGPTFRELLRKVHEFSLRVYANQDVPFESIVEALNPARDLSHTPLFQVMFSMQPTPDALLELPGIDATFLDVDGGTSKFDLHVEFQETSSGVKGLFEYSTELFDRGTIREMIGDYQGLLRRLLEAPDRSIDELRLPSRADRGDEDGARAERGEQRRRLPVEVVSPGSDVATARPLSEAERHRLLVEWNRTEQEFPRDVPIHARLEEQVERTPGAVAVKAGADRLTYRELDARANQLAHHLRRRGVGPEVLVGICVERTAEMVVGLLGILKAGGAYVPLDPEYPRERLALMLEDARVPVLLTQSALRERLPDAAGEVICLDADWPAIGGESDERPASGATAESLAYVIFTSGSTGRPKGVQIPHLAVVNLLSSMAREPGFAASDTLLAVTTLSFDISVLELLLPLVTGGRAVVASREESLDGARLARLLDEHDVTVMQATPATWRMLLESGWSGRPGLKALCGGEAMPAGLAGELLERCGSLWNLYGPTEATVWSTVKRIDSLERGITIGRPIANTQVYLLDEGMEPVGIGAPGELYLGGAGLARGYLDRPELTREKFVAHPFSGEPGARLYRTGDLARYRPDGDLECLGRIDHQVKIRGFRIELGEIEAALGEIDAVSEAVVIAREDTADDKRLVAYLVPATRSEAPTASELRSRLRDRLPAYMVPSAFVVIDRLPLTPNGKVDRQALPAPEESREGRVGEYVAPRTEMEERLAAIWAAALKVDRVGVTDNFFELGGHSLLAVGIMTEVEKSFATDVPLATLFRAPTVEKLAALLGDALARRTVAGERRSVGSERDPICLVPMQTAGSKPPIFFVHGVGGNVLNFSDLIRRLGEDQPCYGLQARGVDGKSTPHSSVQEMAAFYIGEMRDVQPEGPYLLCGFSAGGVIAFEMAKQLGAAGQEIGLLALLDTPYPDYYGARLQRDVKRRIARKGFLASLKGRVRLIRDRLLERLKNARIRAYRRRGRPIPAKLRPQNLAVHFFEALKDHEAGDYPGEVVLFRTGDELGTPGTDLGWGPHVGEIQVIEFDGGHGAFLREPHVAEFSETLARVVAERVRSQPA